MRFRLALLILLVISSCGTGEKRSAQTEDSVKQTYLQNGEKIAGLTQAELLKNVSQAMSKGGPGYAVDFCNLRAMELKDSLSARHNCEIRRIALKYRNPVDKPQTEAERDQLYQYRDAHQKGDSLQAEVYLFEDRVVYYQPIRIDKGTCLVCHGTPGTQIAEETLEIIKARYPDDLATGFVLNDFRGAWKITFLK